MNTSAFNATRSYFFREYTACMTKPLTWKVARNLWRAAGAKARWVARNGAFPSE